MGDRLPARAATAALLAALLAGCGSQIPTPEEYTRQMVGQPVERLLATATDPGSYAARTGWRPEATRQPDGHLVYSIPDSPRCITHWEVNEAGLVVGARWEGSGCR